MSGDRWAFHQGPAFSSRTAAGGERGKCSTSPTLLLEIIPAHTHVRHLTWLWCRVTFCAVVFGWWQNPKQSEALINYPPGWSDFQGVLKLSKDHAPYNPLLPFQCLYTSHFIHYGVFVSRMHYSRPHFGSLHLYPLYFMSFTVVVNSCHFFSPWTRFFAAVCLTVFPPIILFLFLFLDDKDPWHSPRALFNNLSQTIKWIWLSEIN